MSTTHDPEEAPMETLEEHEDFLVELVERDVPWAEDAQRILDYLAEERGDTEVSDDVSP